MIEKKTTAKRLSSFYFTFGLVLSVVLISPELKAQENQVQDTAKVQVDFNKQENTFASDSGYVQTQALDIGSDRGLFILSPDKMMQLRILGSVRAAFIYGDQDLLNKSSLNPFEIPTNLTTKSPNFFASLGQTRIGFEVTRQTKKREDIFIRIEADFAGLSNHFRLRHAYGQFKHLIVGQTWSLFSNVSYQPATASFDGVAGSVSLRTPQIRFFGNVTSKLKWAGAIEYSLPDFIIPDSIQASLLQVIPDITGKLSYDTKLFSGSISGLINTISGRESTDEISYGFGYGGALAGEFTVRKKTRSISRLLRGNQFLIMWGF